MLHIMYYLLFRNTSALEFVKLDKDENARNITRNFRQILRPI